MSGRYGIAGDLATERMHVHTHRRTHTTHMIHIILSCTYLCKNTDMNPLTQAYEDSCLGQQGEDKFVLPARSVTSGPVQGAERVCSPDGTDPDGTRRQCEDGLPEASSGSLLEMHTWSTQDL